MGFLQYKVSPSASFPWRTRAPILLTAALCLLEAEAPVTWGQSGAPSRRCHQRDPAPHLGSRTKGLCPQVFLWLYKAWKLSSVGKTGTNSTFGLQVGRFKGEQWCTCSLALDVIISVPSRYTLGLSILHLKRLPRRECIWCNITLRCDKRVGSKDCDLEHWGVALMCSWSQWAPIIIYFHAGICKGEWGRMIVFSFTLGLSWGMRWW